MNAQVLKTGMIIVAVGVAAFAIYKGIGKIGSGVATGAKAVGNAVNPLSDKNLAYKGAGAVVRAVTDQSNKGNDSLGGWLAERYSRAVHDVGALLGGTGGSVPPTVAQTTMAQAPYQTETISINPFDSGNNRLNDSFMLNPFDGPQLSGLPQSFSTAPYDSASGAADAGASASGTIFADTSNNGEGIQIDEFLL